MTERNIYLEVAAAPRKTLFPDGYNMHEGIPIQPFDPSVENIVLSSDFEGISVDVEDYDDDDDDDEDAYEDGGYPVTTAELASLLDIETSAINVNKPYKPRKLKTDQYHKMMRDAKKRKPHDSLKEANHERTRDRWEAKNKDKIAKRRVVVRDARTRLGLRERPKN